MSNKSTIKRVIRNDPATIVFWEDGTKTVVKCSAEDDYDPNVGLLVACIKKSCGNTTAGMKATLQAGWYIGPLGQDVCDIMEATTELVPAIVDAVRKALTKDAV